METITTTDTSGADFKIAVAIDTKTAVILGIVVFIALVGALFVYKNL